MRKAARLVAAVTGVSALSLVAFAGWSLYPHVDPRPLHAPLVAATSAQGQALLTGAEASADYGHLSRTFQPQSLASYCGVASSVAVLLALGKEATQANFFADDRHGLRSRFNVTFGGMSLDELAMLLRDPWRADISSSCRRIHIEQFRQSIEANLADADGYRDREL